MKDYNDIIPKVFDDIVTEDDVRACFRLLLLVCLSIEKNSAAQWCASGNSGISFMSSKFF
jgi:hypothetical protein